MRPSESSEGAVSDEEREGGPEEKGIVHLSIIMSKIKKVIN